MHVKHTVELLNNAVLEILQNIEICFLLSMRSKLMDNAVFGHSYENTCCCLHVRLYSQCSIP